MIKSMTGFGRSESLIEGRKIVVELRSVNHRYHEVMFRMPKELIVLEDRMKKAIQQYIKRGRVDVYITVNLDEQAHQSLQINWELVNQYLQRTQQLKEKFQVPGQVEIKDLLGIPEIFDVGQDLSDIEEHSEEIIKIVKHACQILFEMRIREGESIYKDFTSRIETLSTILNDVETKAPIVVEEFRQKLRSRVSEWLEEVDFDETRLLNEVAFFAEKANIDEEITRLKSHLKQFENALMLDEPIGRKLDFLIQEMNREVNTIGSKANDIELSQHVVDMKSELEKLREQIQNVE